MRIKVQEVEVKIPKRVEARRDLPRFGIAVKDEESVTLLSKEYIPKACLNTYIAPKVTANNKANPKNKPQIKFSILVKRGASILAIFLIFIFLIYIV